MQHLLDAVIGVDIKLVDVVGTGLEASGGIEKLHLLHFLLTQCDLFILLTHWNSQPYHVTHSNQELTDYAALMLPSL